MLASRTAASGCCRGILVRGSCRTRRAARPATLRSRRRTSLTLRWRTGAGPCRWSSTPETCCCCTICRRVSAATVGLGCCRDFLTETVAANRRIVHQHHEQDALVLGPALQRPRRPEQRRRGPRVVHTRARACDDGVLSSRGGLCRAGHAASRAGGPDARGVSGDPLAVAGGAFAGPRLGAHAEALDLPTK